VIVGSDYTDVGNPTEFGFNATIAANLAAPVALVVTGREPSHSAGRDLALPARSVSDVVRVANSALAEIRSAHASPLGCGGEPGRPLQHDDSLVHWATR
jgi:phosphate acetyltransferase